MFIEQLERWPSKYPVFLRPRRFGKSLFVSTLHHYYGLEHKDNFQKLFGHLYIGQSPTLLANSYMVLRFEFSRIDTATQESTYRGFLANVLEGVHLFLGAYRRFFKKEEIDYLISLTAPEDLIKHLFRVVEFNEIPHRIYVLIDEYDHFANELLSFDMARFKGDVSRNGFVRKFYETLKTSAGSGIVERIFITGVSPVTLDSLTSGFNITSNITTNILFHNTMGFTHAEVEAMLHKANIPADLIPDMMADLADWYNGYMFATTAKERLFNPDMMLYFLQQYSITQTYPDEMLDTNVVSDYRKVRNIFKIGNLESRRLRLLDQVVTEGHIDFSLTQIYNLEGEFKDSDFLSLLFYMGMLSFEKKVGIAWRCRVPNYVIKKLYFEYFTVMQLSHTLYATDTHYIEEAVNTFLLDGNPEPFFKIIEHVLTEHHSNRDDLVYNEKHLQTLTIGLFSPYDAFYLHSEYETGRGYVDLFLERLRDAGLPYDIAIELKHVKKKDRAEAEADAEAEAAKKQMAAYMQTARFARPDVRGFYVVFVGPELYRWEEVRQGG